MYSNNIKYEHLDTLKCYGEMCSHITEFGMRHGVSSVAFLMAEPEKFVNYVEIDETYPPYLLNNLEKYRGYIHA